MLDKYAFVLESSESEDDGAEISSKPIISKDFKIS